MVAADEEGLDARPVEPAEFAHEEQAGRDVAPVAVEYVAGDDEEFRAAVDRPVDQRFHRLAAGGGEGGGDAGVLGAERGEGTVDVQVGSVYELELHGVRIGG